MTGRPFVMLACTMGVVGREFHLPEPDRRADLAVRPQESGISSNWSEGMEPPGIYRIRVTSAVYDYSDESAPFGTPVQTEYLLSNTFEIRP